jgi:single-strand DNA-binding protein
MSNNQIVLIGRVGNDVTSDLKHVGENKVTEVRLAVNRPGKGPDGKPITDWVSCKFWNRQAEILCEYVKKGDLLSVVGALRIDTWEKDGVKQTKYFIHGENFTMLNSKNS